ncbi:MAG: hypothetical protein KDE52_10725, partial [Calditrichaeota bacterium]|nr:hypothetical protein [Calditrichota bacterium]
MYRIKTAKITEKIVALPTSKSVSHGICILGAMNSGHTRIKHLLTSEDLEITQTALQNMGMKSRQNGDVLEIESPIGTVTKPDAFLG